MQSISTLVNVARHLRREPGFVALVVLVLGLALGGTTAMLSVVHGVLLKPLPYGAAERLVVVGHRHADRGEVYGAFSPQDYADLAERSGSVESAAAYMWTPGQSTVNAMLDDKPAQLDASFVTGNFFATLGAQARLGRALTAEDDKPGNDVVVLSDRAWRTLFGADPAIVGRTARIHGRPFEVLGVMPPEFDYPDARVQVYVPQSFLTEDMIPRMRQVRWLEVVARLRPGVAHAEAAREIDAAVASIAADNPETNKTWNHATIKPLFDAITGQSRGPLVALAVATFLVLLTACVNLANLMLARAQRRERELATRGALGATPAQIAAQLFGESVVLTVLGAAFGLGLAQVALRLLQAREAAPLMRQAEIGLSPWVLVVGTLLALLTAVAISAVPVWRARRLDAAMALSRGGVSTTSRRQGSLRATLVVAQVALVCALGYTTALALESFRRLTTVDIGVAAERVLTFNVSLEGPRYEAQGSGAAARQRILAKLRELPGVVSVAGSKNEPVGQTGEGYGFSYVDRPEVPINPDWGVLFVTHGYFSTLGIPLVRGRDFTGNEKPGEAVTMLVNQAFADKFFPGQDVVGKSVRWGDEATVEIVGLAADARHAGPRDAPKPVAYVSLDQISRSSLVVTLRTTSRGSDIVPLAREAVWSVDRELPIVGMRWLDEQIASLSAQSQLLASALSGFALMAALLGGLGVFSLLAYLVGERRRELAIRLAIGERPAGLFRRVVGQGARLALIGIACGVPLGFAAARVLQAELFETRLFEPGVLAAVVLGVAVLALAAAIAPALSALRTQPMTVLRQE